MTTEDHALAHAREVYAACLTVGFVDEKVAALKRLLDLERHGPEQRVEMVEMAGLVQTASVRWAGGRRPR